MMVDFENPSCRIKDHLKGLGRCLHTEELLHLENHLEEQFLEMLRNVFHL